LRMRQAKVEAQRARVVAEAGLDPLGVPRLHAFVLRGQPASRGVGKHSLQGVWRRRAA
jgi:hypothetical protein